MNFERVVGEYKQGNGEGRGLFALMRKKEGRSYLENSIGRGNRAVISLQDAYLGVFYLTDSDSQWDA